jgi:hypothetical protein
LSDKRLALSSLLLAEQLASPVANVSSPNDFSQTVLSVGHRFRHESTLRLLVFTYNSTTSPTDKIPDLAVQVQVIRDNQPVLTTSLRKIDASAAMDPGRIPYAADVSLSDLLPGSYVLQVSVIDRVAKQSATQQTHFEIY